MAQNRRMSMETPFSIWQDVRVVKLVDALVSGRLTEITPVIDICTTAGAVYPEVDKLLGTSGDETVRILNALSAEGILTAKPVEKLYIDPEGSFQLVPVERCPNCHSANVKSGRLIEHFACGNIGLDQGFQSDYGYICPRCKQELRLVGTDYRYLDTRYMCSDCNEMFPIPEIKWRSLKTAKIWAVEDLRYVWLYSYSFNEDKKNWLQLQLEPKEHLVNLLKTRGYQVQELVRMHGSSGAAHTIDILASRDDLLAKFQVGVGILSALPGDKEVGLEELSRFDARSHDMDIDYKVIIAMPKLSAEAAKFAQRKRIQCFDTSDPRFLMSFIGRTAQVTVSAAAEGSALDYADVRNASPVRSRVAAFLRNRGYETWENKVILGKSGVEYSFDVFAERDDMIVLPNIAITIDSDNSQQEININKIAQFDAQASDVGIENRVFISVAPVSSQAQQFAKQRRITLLQQNELEQLIS